MQLGSTQNLPKCGGFEVVTVRTRRKNFNIVIFSKTARNECYRPYEGGGATLIGDVYLVYKLL